MQRLIVVYNPNSSRYADVKRDVLAKMNALSGYMVGKYEIKKTSIEDNVAGLAKILKKDDIVIVAGGDATGVIAANGILKSGKNVRLAVLPYGNFNDLARTLKAKTIGEIVGTKASGGRFYPLEIKVDGELFRYATCYVTIGMTAEAVYIYDKPEMRRKLKTDFGRTVVSYTAIAGWYFKNRRKKQFLPEFKLNGKAQDKRSSDYVAVNGSSIARVMKGGEGWYDKSVFCSGVEKLTSIWRLIGWMARGMLRRVPGNITSGDAIDFCQPATVTIQAEGEYKVFRDVKKIEVKKSKKYLTVIKN